MTRTQLHERLFGKSPVPIQKAFYEGGYLGVLRDDLDPILFQAVYVTILWKVRFYGNIDNKIVLFVKKGTEDWVLKRIRVLTKYLLNKHKKGDLFEIVHWGIDHLLLSHVPKKTQQSPPKWTIFGVPYSRDLPSWVIQYTNQ